jgi:hypothetical protein
MRKRIRQSDTRRHAKRPKVDIGGGNSNDEGTVEVVYTANTPVLTLTPVQEELTPIIECCVCMRSDLDDLVMVVDYDLPVNNNTGVHPIVTLPDCSSNALFNGTIFYANCRKHGVCYSCLKRIALNFDNHPINHKQPFISCPYPFGDGCIADTGVPYYFSHSDIKKVLSDDEYQQYYNHAERFQFPGYEIVKCPRPVLVNNDAQIAECGAWILVPYELIQSTPRGHLVIECDQNLNCQRRSCYHCRGNVRRGFLNFLNNDNGFIGRIDTNGQCDTCLTSTENTNENAFNKYFYNCNKKLKDGKPIFFKNNELTLDIVLQQLEEIADSDKMYSRCFECLTVIYKTEQCNTITHCGIERCYACGRSGSYEVDLGDHWDVTGIKGCPRFDHSTFWNEWGNCNFKCRESQCYNDDIGPCTVPDHTSGITEMIKLRKRAHIYHAIKSLIPSLQAQVIAIVSTNKKIAPFLPKYMCSDYRLYMSDVMHYKLKAAQNFIRNYNNPHTHIHDVDDVDDVDDSDISDRSFERAVQNLRNNPLALNLSGNSPNISDSEDSDNDDTLSPISYRYRDNKNIIEKLANIEFTKIEYPVTSTTSTTLTLQPHSTSKVRQNIVRRPKRTKPNITNSRTV